MSQRLRELLVRMDRADRYWLVGNRRFPIIAGGSNTDPGDSGAEGEPDEGEPEGEPDSEGEPDEGEPKDEDKDEPKDRRSADAERKKREQEDAQRKARQKIANADRRASEAEARARKLQQELDKDKPEVDRLRGELAESEANVSRLQSVNRELALSVAFFRNSNVDWVDPADALTIALRELADLEVDDDGSTEDSEVKKVIASMAKAKPHLVRRQQPKSGAGVGGGGKKDGGQQQQDLARLQTQMPALRGRVLQGQQPPTSQ